MPSVIQAVLSASQSVEEKNLPNVQMYFAQKHFFRKCAERSAMLTAS